MIAYHKDNKLSQMAREILQETERGMTAVAAAFPGLQVAGGYFHYTFEPLVLNPLIFLLDEKGQHVVDALNGNDCDIISYYVAGTLGKGGAEELMNSIQAAGKRLSQEGFRITNIPKNLHLLL